MNTMSTGLSKRLSKMAIDGRHLTDDSKLSESRLQSAIKTSIMPYAKKLIEQLGGTLIHKAHMSLYDCHQFFASSCTDTKIAQPNEENRRVGMKPDGGIWLANLNGRELPMMIIEDKVQGTNDRLFEQNKQRQATGNAIERAAKNIRMAEMLFAGTGMFPYVIFASGCDFHPSETIAKRLEAMNFGVPNHTIVIEPDTTPEEVASNIEKLKEAINIQNIGGKAIASIFVKSHKYDRMAHGASAWTSEEIGTICCRVIDIAIEQHYMRGF